MSLRLEAQAGPSVTPTLWCMIFQMGGKHATENYHLLQKYTKNSQQLFYNFCRSVGHDECTCRSYDLMMDRTPTFRVQDKSDPYTRVQEWRESDFRDANKAKLEEDLEEVADS